ncbi:class II aldolase/adducin family protein [Alicyclobacillus dauci]|uniref:Class II aldolase/adducin family protein n=1 Tax=Alicyclobacillus dauci TaxID=1475485 RepID=A0ABY6Z3P9_9BACL|nr:class II aldolase/adducin family protein [Alicyclobacillus dauci]WAH37508.1 class II aldolase/adducin family protein [Alicyclobacillus dauci]
MNLNLISSSKYGDSYLSDPKPELMYINTIQINNKTNIIKEAYHRVFYSVSGEVSTALQQWFLDGIRERLQDTGYQFHPSGDAQVRLVINVVNPSAPRPYRRKAQATYVVTVVETDKILNNVLKNAYPILIRSLSNLLIYIVNKPNGLNAYFVTLEQGYYTVPHEIGQDDKFFDAVYQRLKPLALSNLIIDNEFHPDLPEELWNGDEVTEQLRRSAKKIDDMNLFPAPFPIQELLPPEDFRHVQRLYGIGGLSYGNLSGRKDHHRFWMSASGVKKGNLEKVGQDMLLVKQFDPDRKTMQLSVPPEVPARRVSVDAIEHWMIYTEHPNVGAIVHIHAWMDGIPSTEVNYPCGTVELARTVAALIRKQPEPSRAVIGLRNHGLTITGINLDDIFERIEGRIIPQVPMK